LLCLRNARAFPLLPAALASVPFGFVLVRVRVRGLMSNFQMNANIRSAFFPIFLLYTQCYVIV